MISHYELVANLVKPGSEILKTLTPEKCHLLHMAFGLAGEAGELLDAVKAHVFYNQDLNVDNCTEEIGDSLFFIEGFCQGINLSPEDAKRLNIAKLLGRYPEGYSDQAAKDRMDKKENV